MVKLYSDTPSKNLKKFGQQQMAVQIIMFLVGVIYCFAAALTKGPVMDGSVYGPSVTSVPAEYWSWPLLVGTMIYMIGLLLNGNWRWSSALRTFGSVSNTIIPFLFCYLAAGTSSLNPFVVATAVTGAFNLWFVFLNIGDLYRAVKRGDDWKKN